MNKGESKFIYIALIVIVLLAGVLIYKVNKTPKNSEQLPNEIIKENKSENFSKYNSNGKAQQLSIKETKEQKVNVGTNQETKVDYITIDNFVITIPSKLKQIGYNIELTNNNTVINITSNDNSYNCKIARFSDKSPYELTEDQETELNNIYDELAEEACSKLGVSKDDDNYYEVFYDEYDKIDSSNERISSFYNKYNIDKYTSFSGFTSEELINAWELIGVNSNNIGSWNSNNRYGGILKTTYKSDTRTSYLWEIGTDENAFNGLFLQTQTYNQESYLRNYEVDFWTWSF